MRIADLSAILASDLPALERMTAIVVASYINEDAGEAWPSIDTIAVRGGMSRASAIRSIRMLRAKGWLSVTRRFSKSTKYQIHHVNPTSVQQPLVSDRYDLAATSVQQPLVSRGPVSSIHQTPLPVAGSNSNISIEQSPKQSNFLADQKPHPPAVVGRQARRKFAKAVIDDRGFLEFWDAYDKKVAQPKALASWSALSLSDRESAVAAVAAYVQSTPDKQFRKDPTTWLNQHCWNDEIIDRGSCQKPQAKSSGYDEDPPEPSREHVLGIAAWLEAEQAREAAAK